ncbi:MAG: bifunctional hydroxymethylpyrimidine kinase/phosphomethylpyrimidine kinase [Kiritimatiellales bacterium]|nr:bifunctional hydroxymethylpyrimidine kinase/phosphomethylpyrimidine kinase [Kiritimatiellota bacterium]MBL7011673.1 bifunctional hydroxymethylpyrimidine kinase/phosphomethylpyrimidine kinase [Kiritimatiellales bacterium]
MNSSSAPELVIVGSIGIDTIETPREKRVKILGGSVSYACAAASFFVQTGMVGVVGTDFPAEHCELWESMGIDLAGLQVEEGKTFRWSGVYEENMDNRRTLLTELNVFETFSPELPEAYRDAPYLFLGNIHPGLQLHVLEQVHSPKFVLIDTMDLWINIARDELVDVVGKCDMLTLNESEARLFTGKQSLEEAAEALLAMGPTFVLIKKGESGSVLVSRENSFSIPAYKLDDFKDPTGAGDTFAGGLMGALAESGGTDEDAIRQAMLYGSVTAAFGVEEFSLERLAVLDRMQIDERYASFRSTCLAD